jgi:hypothetical protein
MSFKVVDDVNKANPDLLPRNLGRTCFRHTQLVVDRLRALGHDAALMCKTGNEGGYAPAGFEPFEIVGMDGTTKFTCTKFSHDAIWCDGKQFDTLGSANEHDRPIYRRNGAGTDDDPNWSFDSSDGPQIKASPAWNEIPAVHWRNNNPPFRGQVGAPVTKPVTEAPKLPGREEMMRAGEWLDLFYSSRDGLQRAEGLSKNGRPDWEGVGAWLFDVYLVARLAGKDAMEARAAVVAAIQGTDEWKEKHR